MPVIDAEQRGLAGAVRPDDAERLAAQQREVDAVGDDHRAEALGDFFEGEDGGHGIVSASPRGEVGVRRFDTLRVRRLSGSCARPSPQTGDVEEA